MPSHREDVNPALGLLASAIAPKTMPGKRSIEKGGGGGRIHTVLNSHYARG
jgi:hypothetical protein